MRRDATHRVQFEQSADSMRLITAVPRDAVSRLNVQSKNVKQYDLPELHGRTLYTPCPEKGHGTLFLALILPIFCSGKAVIKYSTTPQTLRYISL